MPMTTASGGPSHHRRRSPHPSGCGIHGVSEKFSGARMNIPDARGSDYFFNSFVSNSVPPKISPAEAGAKASTSRGAILRPVGKAPASAKKPGPPTTPPSGKGLAGAQSESG
jgi:hypothetical protein